MNTLIHEARAMRRTPEEIRRLLFINEQLKRGDRNMLAEKLGLRREWVSRVISGDGTSERVLQEAEKLIRQRITDQINQGVWQIHECSTSEPILTIDLKS